ncbi:hypothetical protein CH63R_01463 [Colletotrichum higginsianum IMI 349063]|uniref:Uncharacterized protein n=1 Tax=Colletotrichum higginsianum (strain IMI 349063) TaxID=759273 RepID=A0A1B7YW75_COLHI|nr:hypothetical protein CH63R_01463 [Colletotrichum higginsianum IMI 349063]OBR16283.1 hypothetical protein CH63R_01463 [Colletotrichum higginsianum IMI 349063]
MQRTGPLLVKYGGSTPLGTLPTAFKSAVETVSKTIEGDISPKSQHLVFLQILIFRHSIPRSQKPESSSVPHKSHKDKDDDKDVITVSYHTEKGTRVTSVHVHEDNTWKEFPSRNASKGR